MSDRSATSAAGLDANARALIERASQADARARWALRGVIADLFVTPDQRLDDHARAMIAGLLERQVDRAAAVIGDSAVASLKAQGHTELAGTLDDRSGLAVRLADAGLLRDNDLMAECLARVRLDQIAAHLPLQGRNKPDLPSLLVRLGRSSDPAVASAAARLLASENARRAEQPGGDALPPDLNARMLWWVAAALRERAQDSGIEVSPLDRALAEAALAEIGSPSEQVEDDAVRLARAIDAREDEIPVLLEEALGDRQLILFAALLAHASRLSYPLARDVVLDPLADRLSLVLRGLDLPRRAIAWIGAGLCEGDGRRDIDTFVDTLDVVAQLDPLEARRATARLRLHPDYRAALDALGAGARA